MEWNNIVKQINDANAVAFENVVNMMASFQEKTDEMVKSAIDSMPVSRDIKTAVEKTRETCKRMTDRIFDMNKEGYDKLSKAFMASQIQAAEMMKTAMENSMAPEGTRKIFQDAMDSYKENFNRTKVVFDENLAKVEGLIRA